MEKKRLDTKAVRKYWGKVIKQAFEPAWNEVGMRVIIIGLALALIITALVSFGTALGLPIPIPLIFFQANRVQAGLQDFILSVGILIVLFLLMVYRIPVEMDNEKIEKIKELEPVKANIEINVPIDGFRNEDIVKLIVVNKNKTADLEKCFARLEFIGNVFINGEKIETFPVPSEYHQKNVLWDRKNVDGTITIAADGREILNVVKVNNDGFNFLFQDNEKYEMIIQTSVKNRFHNYLVVLKLFGHFNGHPIEEFQEFYTIHLEFHSVIQQIPGREMTDQELASALSNQQVEPRFQIRKIEIISTEKNIKKDTSS